MRNVARAIEAGETRGFMKAVVDGGSDRILGCAILGRALAIAAIVIGAGIAWQGIHALDAQRWLGRVYQALSPDEQTLITLHELEGWPVANLAELFGKSEPAIKTSLFRARRKMKNALQKLSKQATRRRATTPKTGREEDALPSSQK